MIATALATGIAARAARDAVGVATANFHQDQRAWVGLGPIDILNKPIAGEALKIRAKVANSGKSPAIHVIPEGVLAPIRIVQGDYHTPFLDRPELAACRGPKPQWRDDLGGSLLLPQAENATLDRLSPPLNASLAQALAGGGKTITPSEQDLRDTPALEEVPGVKNWLVSVYWVGCINYFDIFREAHRTSFCLIYVPSEVSPNGQFASCPKGNDGD